MAHQANRGVLVVDAERAILQMLHLALGDSGFTVYPAATATEALEFCHQHHPAIALLETELGGASTYPLLTDLRRAQPTLQICLVSAGHNKHLAHDWGHLGVACCLCKPFTLDRLREILEQLVNR